MDTKTIIEPKQVRYIKLGRGGEWEDISLDRGELHFGHHRVPHELALAGDREAIRLQLMAGGREPQAASDDAREILDFYTLGADCLWVTIAREKLWWTFADTDVTWLGEGDGHGARIRRCLGGAWRHTDTDGKILHADGLSSRLTRTASYRRTICAVDASDYLLRRINATLDPIAVRASAAHQALLEAVADAIAALHWRDFETLVDVVFARSGWNRISSIGGTQKLVDLVIEQPSIGERAGVQVKSQATQAVLEGFVAQADAADAYDRLYFVCHSPRGALVAPAGRADVHVWHGRDFAATVLRVGLADWVMAKAA